MKAKIIHNKKKVLTSIGPWHFLVFQLFSFPFLGVFFFAPIKWAFQGDFYADAAVAFRGRLRSDKAFRRLLILLNGPTRSPE